MIFISPPPAASGNRVLSALVGISWGIVVAPVVILTTLAAFTPSDDVRTLLYIDMLYVVPITALVALGLTLLQALGNTVDAIRNQSREKGIEIIPGGKRVPLYWILISVAVIVGICWLVIKLNV